MDIPENLTSIAGGSSSYVNIQVKNVTDHKIVLPGRTALGHLQQVKSVTPIEVKKKQEKSVSEEIQENNKGKNTPKVDGWLPDVDLDGLDESQKEIAKQMLMENLTVLHGTMMI